MLNGRVALEAGTDSKHIAKCTGNSRAIPVKRQTETTRDLGTTRECSARIKSVVHKLLKAIMFI